MSNVYALSFVPPGAILDVYEREIHPELLELAKTHQSIKKFIVYLENT